MKKTAMMVLLLAVCATVQAVSYRVVWSAEQHRFVLVTNQPVWVPPWRPATEHVLHYALPDLVPDTNSGAKSASFTISPLSNDRSRNGLPLHLVSVSTTNGTASLAGTNVLFTSDNSYVGHVFLVYVVADTYASNVSSINVNLANQTPVTTEFQVAGTKNTTMVVDLLSHASDPDNDALTVTSLSDGPWDPIFSLSLSVSNNYGIITPATNYVGTNTLRYYVDDGFSGGIALGILRIVVSNTIAPPIANQDSVAGPKTVACSIPVLTNDSDPNGFYFYVSGTSATNGLATTDGTNVFYTPVNNYTGAVSVAYTITSSSTLTSNSTVLVTLTNRYPVLAGTSNSARHNIPFVVSPMPAASDPDGDSVSLVDATATHASAAVTNGSSILVVPDTNYLGDMALWFTITDGQDARSVTNTVTLTNTDPVPVTEYYTAPHTATLLLSVLTNDSDPDWDPVHLTTVSVTNGSASISGTNVSLTPPAGFLGALYFTYSIADPFSGSASMQDLVTFTNRLPVTTNITITALTNTSLTVSVLTNSFDPDGDTLSLTDYSQTNCIASISGTNLMITLSGNTNAASVGYKVQDALGGTVWGVVTLVATVPQPYGIIPQMTGYTSPSGTVTESDNWGGAGWKAFTTAGSWDTHWAYTSWVKYDFGHLTNGASYFYDSSAQLVSGTPVSASDRSVQVSLDNTTWTAFVSDENFRYIRFMTTTAMQHRVFSGKRFQIFRY